MLLVTLIASGCATTEFVQLREKPRNPLTERLNTTTFGLVTHSPRTDHFLKRTGYRGREDLKKMIQHAAQQRDGGEYFEATHATAELKYLAAETIRSRDPHLAIEMYLDSSRAAWSYFATADSHGVHPDPNASDHRSTAEVYNASTESVLRIAREKYQLKLGRSLVMPLTSRRLMFDVPFSSRLLTADQLGDFEFVSDFELKNLRARHASHGLGVPVIALRKIADPTDPLEKYYPDGMSFAATVVLRFEDTDASSGAPYDAQLQIYDPRESADLVIADHALMPLETDVSTPLARYLTNPDMSLLDTWGFLRPDRAREVEGLYMVQPYDPERIPVLMVHGLWSSPITWMEMFNELQSDPEIRRKYQFWFYLYPTGEPIAFSAAELREELTRVRNDCDPYRRNSRLDDMVVVGHSMGGLMGHLLTINSGDRLWNTVSNKPVEELRASDETRAEIRRVYFFQSNPSIDCVITIGSPYGGSSLSNRFTRWLTGSIIRLPARTYDLTRVMFEQNGSRWWDREETPRTSIDSLTKKSAVLRLIRDTKVPEDVRHHNIVGIRKGSNPSTWSDGVVSFASAHREDVESEKLVTASHRELLRHPDSVQEVRRILLEHLRRSHKHRYPVHPVQMTVELPDEP